MPVDCFKFAFQPVTMSTYPCRNVYKAKITQIEQVPALFGE